MAFDLSTYTPEQQRFIAAQRAAAGLPTVNTGAPHADASRPFLYIADTGGKEALPHDPWIAGRMVGNRFGGDPYVAAGGMGLAIVPLPPGERGAHGRPLAGYIQHGTIRLDMTQDDECRAETLAHELGHACGFDAEADADVFAVGFLAQSPWGARYRDEPSYVPASPERRVRGGVTFVY